MMIERRTFLGALSAASLGRALLATPAAAASPAATPKPLERALVLSGGGARGAYEAGIISGLAGKAAVGDGQPLAPYGITCGTSIGALNGWFVATGQYTQLRELWSGIASQNLLKLKPQFAALRNAQSGVGNRLMAAIRLIGLTKNEPAVLESQPVLDWIERHIDSQRPLVMPLVWAVTNLTTQRPEYFFARPPGSPKALPQRLVHSLQLTLGPNTAVREITVDLLHRALFASAAIPLAFDPVELPGPDGTPNLYVDGGVASNSAVAIAHSVARAADIVLMDPPFEPQTAYEDAVAIAFGAYGTMQRKILEIEMRDTYFQSVARRAYSRLGFSNQRLSTTEQAHLARFMSTVPETDLFYTRPKSELPLGVVSFNDQKAIAEAFQIGYDDAARGFTPYTWETFEL